MGKLKIFQFNQKDIELLISSNVNDDLMISYFVILEHGDEEPYLGAQSCDKITGAYNPNIDPPPGCPVPPGWQPAPPTPVITHAQLAGCPKFFLDAALKKKILNNKYVDRGTGETLLHVNVELDVNGSRLIDPKFVIMEKNGGVLEIVTATLKP